MGKIDKHKILLVLIHYLDKKVTDDAIASIRRGSLIPDIAVLSDESDIDHFRKQGVFVIKENENRGYASRLNTSAGFAIKNGYEYIIFANNDIIVMRDTIEKMYSFINANPESIVGPVILNEEGRIQSAGIRLNLITGRSFNLYYNAHISSIKRSVILPDAVAGTFLLLKASILQSLKFDERYDFYFEDVSFCLSASELKIRPIVLTDAIIIHRCSNSIKHLPLTRIAEMVTRNHLLTIRKHTILKDSIFRVIPFSLTIGYNLLFFGIRGKNYKSAIKGVIMGAIKAFKEN